MKYKSIVLMLTLLVIASAMSVGAAEFRGFWVDAWHSGFENSTATQSMVNYIGSCNSNAIIVEVRKRGDAYYASTLEPTGTNVTPAAGYDCLADVVTKAHAAGKQVYAWVVVYRVWTSTTAPATTSPDHVFNTHPEWFNLTNTGAKFDGSNNSFLDPGHPGVEDFNISVFKEIITNYNIDGFVLDYIRYPGTTWGYNATSVARYNAEYNLSGNPVYTDTQWSNWRRDQVTNTVKRIYLEAKAIKPSIKMGAAVWNSASTGNSSYFQNWDLWMSSHFLDFASPMMYSTNNTTFDNWAVDAYNRQYGRHIYPAQGSYLNTISNSMTQIQDVQTRGFLGVTPYCYAVTNSGTVDRTGFKNSLIAGPFPTTASIPAMSWITSPTYGMLKGTVKNSSGAAIYPATVTISSKSTKNSGTGFYGFVDIAPGTYTVTASATGYSQGSGNVTITAGQVATLDFTLTTGGGGGGDIIIDNPSATYTGTWTTGTSSTDKYGADYRYANTAATENATAKWTPNIPTAGSYEVYVWYPMGSNRSTAAPYTIYYNGGNQTYTVNQTVNGGQWILLGTKSFAAGTSGYVKLGNGTGEASKVVMADAVKFVPVAATEYIVDNTGASFTGTWSTGTSSTDKYGSDYRYATTATSETATAKWAPNLAAGNYDVYCWYPQGANRSAAAPYTVYYNGGSVTTNVNQQSGGGQWVLLTSNKSFLAGTSGYVKLGNGTGESALVVMADAVRFVKR